MDRLDAETRATLLAGVATKTALRRNRHKAAWRPDELHRLLSCKLDEEVRELQFALAHESHERQVEEAQDVVATAAIILELVVRGGMGDLPPSGSVGIRVGIRATCPAPGSESTARRPVRPTS